MTKSLEQALQTMRELPDDVQEVVAERVLHCIDLIALEDDSADRAAERQ